MELNIRDWLLVIGVLLLLAVALDGYRRARKERQNHVRLSRNARRSAKNYKSEGTTGAPFSDNAEVSAAKVLNPESSDDTSTEAAYAVDPLFDDPFREPALTTDGVSAAETEIPSLKATPDHLDSVEPALEQARDVPAEPEEIILLNVMARDQQMLNEKKLQTLLQACDCRFQKSGVFYRFEKELGQGDVQFSVLNMIEPGVFDSETLEGLQTPGVSFLLCLPGPQNPTEAVNCMIETAQCVARNLDATLKDENLSSVTEQRLESHRQQVRDYLKRKLLTPET